MYPLPRGLSVNQVAMLFSYMPLKIAKLPITVISRLHTLRSDAALLGERLARGLERTLLPRNCCPSSKRETTVWKVRRG